jgi:hypothetical protein
MEGILYAIIIFLSIVLAGALAYAIYMRQKNYKELCERYEKELNEKFRETLRRLKEAQEEYGTTQEEYIKEFQHLQEVLGEIKEKEHFNQTLYKIREEELNNLIENKKQTELEKLDREVEDWATSAQEAASFCSTQFQESIQKEWREKEEELSLLKNSIDDYKARRDVINQEILRARAIEEQQDFYRIILPESSKHDLEVLSSIRKELTKVDILDKLVYDNYVKKPVDEMVKRVLEGRSPCGIYKITRLKTGEIYIGKSTDIKSRWQQHSKSAYHCGTISHSTLHTIIEKDGIEGFTWEVLEEVSKDKLGEREKYWIDFYDSKNFGLNERNGG